MPRPLNIQSGAFETTKIDPSLLPSETYLLDAEKKWRSQDETMKVCQPFQDWPALPLKAYLMHLRINAVRNTPLTRHWMESNQKHLPRHFANPIIGDYFTSLKSEYPTWRDIPQWLCIPYVQLATKLKGGYIPLLIDTPHGRGVVGVVWAHRIDVIYPDEPKKLVILEDEQVDGENIRWVEDEMLVRNPL